MLTLVSSNAAFLASTAPVGARISGTTTVAAIAILLGLAIVLAMLIVIRLQNRGRVKRCRLEISNTGNIRSSYALQAEEPSGNLRFEFTLNGATLHQPQVGGAAAQPLASPASAASAGEPRQSIAQTSRGVSAAADKAASLSDYLPSGMGANVRQVAVRLHNLGGGLPYPINRVVQFIAGLFSAQPPASQILQPSGFPAGAAPLAGTGRQAIRAAPATDSFFAKTPFVEPGETCVIDLRITPVNVPDQSARYPFTVVSKSVEQEGASPVIEKTSVQIERLSWFDRYYVFMVGAVIVTMILLVVFLLFVF
jgi:hypothetical protein